MRRALWLLVVPLFAAGWVVVQPKSGPPPPLPPPVFEQPEVVPQNLPLGLRTPPANFAPDGGSVFPLTQKGIGAVMDEAWAGITQCHDTLIPSQRRVELSLRVSVPDGGDQAAVDRVHALGARDPAFADCVLSVVSTYRFEPPLDSPSVEIVTPATFEPAPDAGP